MQPSSNSPHDSVGSGTDDPTEKDISIGSSMASIQSLIATSNTKKNTNKPSTNHTSINSINRSVINLDDDDSRPMIISSTINVNDYDDDNNNKRRSNTSDYRQHNVSYLPLKEEEPTKHHNLNFDLNK
eukprot:27624_1